MFCPSPAATKSWILSPRKQPGQLDSALSFSSSSQTSSLSLPRARWPRPQNSALWNCSVKASCKTLNNSFPVFPRISSSSFTNLTVLILPRVCGVPSFSIHEKSQIGAAVALHGRGCSSFLKHKEPHSSKKPHLGVSVFVFFSLSFQLRLGVCAGSFKPPALGGSKVSTG